MGACDLLQVKYHSVSQLLQEQLERQMGKQAVRRNPAQDLPSGESKGLAIQ